MPSNSALRLMNGAHRLGIKLSRGRLGWRAYGMPMLELTTTGRRSGEKRSTMLSSPLQQGDTIVVVASRGGDDKHPAWFLNIEANPDVEVVLEGGDRRRMRGRPATAEERAALWPRITREHRNYAGYQKKTAREIPLVLLEP
ncbi:nitroreductase/quinone reductase family protein [soil metagenome]